MTDGMSARVAQAHSVAASSIVGLLAYADAIGVPTNGVLEAAGLTRASLAGPEARIPEGANNKVWELLAEASKDAEFVLHFAERMTVDAFDVVGHLLARSRTFSPSPRWPSSSASPSRVTFIARSDAGRGRPPRPTARACLALDLSPATAAVRTP